MTRTNFYYNPSILQVLTEREIDNKLLVVPEKDHFNLITELYDPTDTLTKVSNAHLCLVASQWNQYIAPKMQCPLDSDFAIVYLQDNLWGQRFYLYWGKRSTASTKKEQLLEVTD
mgnify:CR=1 FL=1